MLRGLDDVSASTRRQRRRAADHHVVDAFDVLGEGDEGDEDDDARSPTPPALPRVGARRRDDDTT
jgi:hypothetical protein